MLAVGQAQRGATRNDSAGLVTARAKNSFDTRTVTQTPHCWLNLAGYLAARKGRWAPFRRQRERVRVGSGGTLVRRALDQ